MLTRTHHLLFPRHNPLSTRLPVLNFTRCYANIDKSNPTRKTKFTALDDEMKELHLWIQRFTLASVPRDLCKVSYSRSSGPGGQNVNKLNTKVSIRMNIYEIEEKLNWPHTIIDALRDHRDTTKTGDVIITSQRHRTQTQNLQDAWEKLYHFVKNIVELPGYTHLGAQERIEKLIRKDKEHVREWKTMRSLKKQARKGKFSRDLDSL